MTTDHTSEDQQLLPCPFPHEVKRGVFLEIDTEDFFMVRGACSDCGACGPFVSIDGEAITEKDKAEAARLWNARSTTITDHTSGISEEQARKLLNSFDDDPTGRVSRRAAIRAIITASQSPIASSDELVEALQYRARPLDGGVCPPFRAVVDGPDGWPICHCHNLTQAEFIAQALASSRPASAQVSAEHIARTISSFVEGTDFNWREWLDCADAVLRSLPQPSKPANNAREAALREAAEVALVALGAVYDDWDGEPEDMVPVQEAMSQLRASLKHSHQIQPSEREAIRNEALEFESNWLHPSHEVRASDASTFDFICDRCGATDEVPGGWGDLSKPCALKSDHLPPNPGAEGTGK